MNACIKTAHLYSTFFTRLHILFKKKSVNRVRNSRSYITLFGPPGVGSSITRYFLFTFPIHNKVNMVKIRFVSTLII